MRVHDVVVVGSGISGLSFAHRAAGAGKRVLVLERRERIGGCIHSRRGDDGYWYELGAHTVYNSYSRLLDIAVAAGLADRLVRRGPARARFGLLKNGRVDWLTPPRVLLKLNWLEAALCGPVGIFRGKEGRTVEEYYSGLVGRGNFRRVLSPFFAAVPSQRADAFPVSGPGSLFKKRPRREEFPRSFGLPGGLGEICAAIAAHEKIEVRTGVGAESLRPAGGGFILRTDGGEEIETRFPVLAATHREAARLVRDLAPELSAAIAAVGQVAVESFGVRVRRERCWMPECAFVVPVEDVFYSVVTRDPFPDPDWRAFAFHFREGLGREEKIARISGLLRVSPGDLEEPAEERTLLPAPRVGHAGVVAEIDRRLEGLRLGLTGNYFQGLAIEDCIARSESEWERLRALS